MKDAGLDEPAYAGQLAILNQISNHLQQVYNKVNKMIEQRKIVNNMDNTRTKAIAYCNEIKERYFDDIRYHADKLEALVSDSSWTLPKYRELLFLR